MVFKDNIIPEARIRNARSGSNLTCLPNHGLAFYGNAWIDDAVAAKFSFGANVSVGWIEKRYAVVDHQFTNGIATHEIFECREFGPRVDAGKFTSIAMQLNVYLLAV